MIQTVVIGSPPPLDALSINGSIALFLDFDGTLIEIAPTPDGIEIPARMAARLEQLAERHGGRVALVSGRSLDNLAGHLGDAGIARAGSHGAERKRADGRLLGDEPAAIPAGAAQAAEAFARSRDGVEYEAKRHGAAVHYRGAPALEGEVIGFAVETAAAHGLVVKRGKCVAELVHRGADKAGAVRAFMAEPPFRGSVPIFVGDDITDEDGFRAATEMGGFGVIVGDRPSAFARYRLANPAEVHAWLTL